MSARNEQLIVIDDDGLEVIIPSLFELCPRCHGKGQHDHPAFANGISADDWNGPDWDDDSRSDYIDGRYDVACSECGGKRVVLVPDESRLTQEQRALVEEQQRDMAQLRADERSERFMCEQS